MAVRIGVDTGGTFTDFIRFDGQRVTVRKLRSTPDDPSRAIVEGIHALCPDADARDLEVVHGSTVATNAVLERKGAAVGLVTTRGFEDVLLIGRQTRPELYNIFVKARRPLVEAGRTFGVSERVGPDGEVLVAVRHDDVTQIIEGLRAARVEIAAVCLLHSYANPAHEIAIAAALRAAGIPACTSSDVLPEYREFERWSTTALNAYVTPIVDRYLGNLERSAPGRLSIMQSNGGSISAAAARAHAVRTVLSGPAAGVVGAQVVAAAAGFPRAISFDMGGTSTDVALIDREVARTSDASVGDFPVRLPVVDIETVGAGGGSIASIDAGGALRVGPASAGADPGPVCYGRGEQLTVTDANLLLGRLDPEQFFGGRMTIDVERTRRVAGAMGRRLRIDTDELADGIIRVANATMERAIRVVSVERGHDPRDFALLAFGGAGGMHACDIAERLEIGTVVVPKYAGVLSALGMLVADVARDYSRHLLVGADAIGPAALKRRFLPLMKMAREDLRAEGFSRGRQRVTAWLDVRYVGQSSELTVPFTPDFRGVFDRAHERRYGYADTARPTEIVSLRVAARGLIDRPRLPFSRPRAGRRAVPVAVRRARFGGRDVRTGYYSWPALQPGARGAGPAVITSGEATVVVPPAFRFSVDGFGNLRLDRAR